MTIFSERWDREKQRESNRKYCDNNKEKIAAKNKRWGLANPEKLRGYARKWKMSHPEQTEARYAIHNAVRNGTITRPKTCAVCGEGGVKTDGHHLNYDDVYSVVWVCRKCHRPMRNVNGQN